MRILHIYSGNMFGGIESILATIGRRRSNDCAEHEFALCFEGRLSSVLEADGAPVHRLGAVTARRPGTVTAARRELRLLLREREFDRVICHAPWSQALFGGVVRRSGRPQIFWAHDVMTGRHWTERLARRTVPDLVICNSRFTQKSLSCLYPRVASTVVYAPVDPPPSIGTADRDHLRADLETSGESVVIVQACRSEKWKGQTLLLEALIALKDVPCWTWWLAGGAQRRPEHAFLASLREKAARAGIGDRVRWLGERTDVARVLAAADLYCQPNLAPEPFGIAYVEALGAGLPVVAARHGGAEEIVDETCGVLVAPRDVAGLSRALRELVADEPRRGRLGRQARTRARALCDPELQLERLAQVVTQFAPMPVSA
jgi:glycosyltransferase involved in cell wall biosynthesis